MDYIVVQLIAKFIAGMMLDLPPVKLGMTLRTRGNQTNERAGCPVGHPGHNN